MENNEITIFVIPYIKEYHGQSAFLRTVEDQEEEFLNGNSHISYSCSYNSYPEMLHGIKDKISKIKKALEEEENAQDKKE